MQEEQKVHDVQQGLADSVKYITGTFIEDTHYKSIHQTLAGRWERLQSLSAAVKLMESYGVKLTAQDEERLARMQPEQQINSLVLMMPQQSNDQFQEFFLKLQLLVSSATRVRRGLEEGQPDTVAQALDDATATGIAPYMLRMAIVQAGNEVAVMRQRYQAWVKDASNKTGRLIRGQEDALSAKKKLASTQAYLALHAAKHIEKSKKVLLNFINGNNAATRATMFRAWVSYAKYSKAEAEIREEFGDRIDGARTKLIGYKVQQLDRVRNALMKKSVQEEQDLLLECIGAWRSEVEEAKFVATSEQKKEELVTKLGTIRVTQSDNAKKVITRLATELDSVLFTSSFQAWIAFHQDFQKEKEFMKQVEKSQALIEEFVKSKSEGAKKLLGAMGRGTDSGLLQFAFKAWLEFLEEAKHENEIAETINAHAAKFRMFAHRRRASNVNMLDRGRRHGEEMLLLRALGSWRLDTKMEAALRFHHAKIDAKRQQLVGVQHMFRTFALQLESGLKQGQDSSRGMKERAPFGRKLGKTDGTVSLPDIHQRPGDDKLGRPQRQPSMAGGAPSSAGGGAAVGAGQPAACRSPQKDYRGSPSAASASTGAGQEAFMGAPRAAWG